MDFLISASTDIGISKSTNQDSLIVRRLDSPMGRMVFAVLCDGMGGLEKGEVASASLVGAFNEWVDESLSKLCKDKLFDFVVRSQWEGIIKKMNERICSYGKERQVELGTTATIMLLTESRYYLMNVGDSRAYELTDGLRQLTKDQTFVAREIERGNMTPEQAKTDPRRNVLLQCVGASSVVIPDMFYGNVRRDAVYMLCSDGFRHVVTPDEIYSRLKPSSLTDTESMRRESENIIRLNKQRHENDNISVIVIKTI